MIKIGLILVYLVTFIGKDKLYLDLNKFFYSFSLKTSLEYEIEYKVSR